VLRQRREQLRDEPPDGDPAPGATRAPDEAVQVALPDVDDRLAAAELAAANFGCSMRRDALRPRGADGFKDGHVQACGQVEELLAVMERQSLEIDQVRFKGQRAADLEDVRPAEGTAEGGKSGGTVSFQQAGQQRSLRAPPPKRRQQRADVHDGVAARLALDLDAPAAKRLLDLVVAADAPRLAGAVDRGSGRAPAADDARPRR
jgi:hypothetical protein